jgi:hypothetical protein
MAILGNLDYESAKASDLIPDGEYEAQIIASEMNPTKDGSGKMLVLTLEVIVDGAKRRLWERLNIVNRSVEAQRIGTRQLMSYAEATGVAIPVRDSEELHLKPFLVKVGVKDEGGNFGPKNVVRKVSPWRATGGRPVTPPPATGAGASAPSQPAQKRAVAASDMPWD